jgi:hypothetical protein
LAAIFPFFDIGAKMNGTKKMLFGCGGGMFVGWNVCRLWILMECEVKNEI